LLHFLTERAEKKALIGYFWKNRRFVAPGLTEKEEKTSKKSIFVTNMDLFRKKSENLKKSGFLGAGGKTGGKNRNLSRKSGQKLQ